MKLGAFVLACGFFLVAAAPARADEIDALEKELATEHAKLSTSDCTDACRALGSIRRAADKICALEPGSPRCTSAQAKSNDATERVRAACPDCAIAHAFHPPAPEAPATKTMEAEAGESRRGGGCAGCAVLGSGANVGGSSLWLLLAAAGTIARVRRSGRRRDA